MSRKSLKRYLMLLSAVGLLAVGTSGSGTFASFNAEVANTGNYFQTGTLFLHNSTGGTTCTSESASDNANLGTGDTCNYLFHITDATTPSYYNVALKNAGSIDAVSIKYYAYNACSTAARFISTGATVNGTQNASTINVSGLLYSIQSGTKVTFGASPTQYTTSGATAAGASSITLTGAASVTNGDAVNFAPQFNGGGDLCSQLQYAIWEVPNSGTVTPGANPCAISVCDFSKTLDQIPANAGAAGSQLTLSSGGGSGNSLTKLSSNGTRFFLIGVQPPSNLSNTYQNQKATLDIAWRIDQ